GLTRRKPVPFMEANGVSIHFDVAGHGPSVVLLHEMGGTLDSWDGIVPALSQRFRTLRYDQRGFGWSEKVRQPYTVETLVDDLEAVLAGARGPPPPPFFPVAPPPLQAPPLLTPPAGPTARVPLRAPREPHRHARRARGEGRAGRHARGHSGHPQQVVAAGHRRPRRLCRVSRPLSRPRSELLRRRQPGGRALQRDTPCARSPPADHGGR